MNLAKDSIQDMRLKGMVHVLCIWCNITGYNLIKQDKIARCLINEHKYLLNELTLVTGGCLTFRLALGYSMLYYSSQLKVA
jgi:hypothetical protein